MRDKRFLEHYNKQLKKFTETQEPKKPLESFLVSDSQADHYDKYKMSWVFTAMCPEGMGYLTDSDSDFAILTNLIKQMPVGRLKQKTRVIVRETLEGKTSSRNYGWAYSHYIRDNSSQAFDVDKVIELLSLPDKTNDDKTGFHIIAERLNSEQFYEVMSTIVNELSTPDKVKKFFKKLFLLKDEQNATVIDTVSNDLGKMLALVKLLPEGMKVGIAEQLKERIYFRLAIEIKNRNIDVLKSVHEALPNKVFLDILKMEDTNKNTLLHKIARGNDKPLITEEEKESENDRLDEVIKLLGNDAKALWDERKNLAGETPNTILRARMGLPIGEQLEGSKKRSASQSAESKQTYLFGNSWFSSNWFSSNWWSSKESSREPQSVVDKPPKSVFGSCFNFGRFFSAESMSEPNCNMKFMQDYFKKISSPQYQPLKRAKESLMASLNDANDQKQVSDALKTYWDELNKAKKTLASANNPKALREVDAQRNKFESYINKQFEECTKTERAPFRPFSDPKARKGYTVEYQIEIVAKEKAEFTGQQDLNLGNNNNMK